MSRYKKGETSQQSSRAVHQRGERDAIAEYCVESECGRSRFRVCLRCFLLESDGERQRTLAGASARSSTTASASGVELGQEFRRQSVSPKSKSRALPLDHLARRRIEALKIASVCLLPWRRTWRPNQYLPRSHSDQLIESMPSTRTYDTTRPNQTKPAVGWTPAPDDGEDDGEKVACA